MRGIVYCCLVGLIIIGIPELSAQAPSGINYQGIARDVGGKPLPEKDISLRISILQDGASGAIEYDEVHEVKTNAFGLFTLIIGKGEPGTGNFKFISWALGNKWLQVEMDVNGGRNFQLSGSQELMSVPYALYAGFAGNGLQAGDGIEISNNKINNTGDADDNPGNELITSFTLEPGNKLRITDAGGTKEADLGGLAGGVQDLSGVLAQGNSAGALPITNLGAPVGAADAATKSYVDNHIDADADPLNEIQALADVLSVGNNAGGSPITNLGAPAANTDAATKQYVDGQDAADGDKSNTNEIQSISKAGSVISLNLGGGSVNLLDDNPLNEIQTLAAQTVDVDTRSISISSGNAVNVDVRDADASTTNEAQALSKSGAIVTLTDVGGTGGGTFVLNDDSNTNEAQTITRTGSTVSMTQANGAGGGSFSVDDADANATNEAQTLTKLGNTIVLSDVGGAGGGIINDAVDDADSNPTNEIQGLLLTGFNLSISSGNSVLLPLNSNAFQFSYNHTVPNAFTGNSAANIDPANVELDISTALNTATEEYVVPFDGVYAFFVYGTINGFNRVGVRVNGNDLTVRFVMSMPTTPLLSMGSVLINLTAGDRVQVVGEKTALGVPATMIGNFSGYKL